MLFSLPREELEISTPPLSPHLAMNVFFPLFSPLNRKDTGAVGLDSLLDPPLLALARKKEKLIFSLFLLHS